MKTHTCSMASECVSSQSLLFAFVYLLYFWPRFLYFYIDLQFLSDSDILALTITNRH